MRARVRSALVCSLILSIGVAVPAPAAATPNGSNGPEAGLLGTAVTGTGILPHFKAKGSNLVRLLAGAFDPLTGRNPAPRGIPLVTESALPGGTAQYWLVQVRDQRFPEATRAVEAAGGKVVGIVPDATYMVRATPEQRALMTSSPAVRWAGYYQPAWRTPIAAGGRNALFELKGTQTYRVHLFRAEREPRAALKALQALREVKIVSDSGHVIDVRATAAQLAAIASVPAVEWVGVRPKVVPLNANSRWVNDTGIRDLYAATAPGRLTGAGQTTAVADTAVNYTYDLNGRAHVAFRDCDAAGVCKEAVYTQLNAGTSVEAMTTIKDHGTNHRKMVAFFDLGNTGPNPYDESSHGSHTGGSVDGDQPPYGEYTEHDGLAPAAMHVHQNIGTTGGGLDLPDDDYQLWRQAYRPRDPASVPMTSPPQGNVADYANYVPLEDARTHNNSYGLIAPVIDESSAVRLDQFVWDHEDMVIVVSAGNDGPGPASIGSPSVAKNELSSGASVNGRQPMASIDSMAIFSSHGPTGDGRFGPDLATPGQIVISVKGGTEDGYHVAQGTSMSGPVLTGLATLARQYFYDGYGPDGGKGFAGGAPSDSRQHNPSAALTKATLINGAVRMRGWYTGDDGNLRELDGQWPSAGQGFGRVDLNNSLYFNNDPTNNWYYDVWRGDAEAFPVSGLPATRSYQIKAQAGAPLDVTLAWTDAPDLLPAGTPALVNDLNLTVTGPTGMLYVGNNMNSRTVPGVEVAETLPGPGVPDAKNLTERIRIAAPAAGSYTIEVTAPPIAIGNQGFALAASGRVSEVGQNFSPGPPLQDDQAGGPVISDVAVQPVSADAAKVRFTTNEPTTAEATLTIDGTPVTFVDSYNLGPQSYHGLNTGDVETSDEYANKPVVSTSHEILITGTDGGQTYPIDLSAEDLAGNVAGASATLITPAAAWQPDAPDIAQLVSTDAAPSGWKTGTQMYAGTSVLGVLFQRLIGAYMFRIPEDAVDPDAITGAVVEMTSSHNWVPYYVADPVFSVDLLDESVEAAWGTQNYSMIRSAPSPARAFPETTHKRGATYQYGFTFRCADLQALKDSLSTVAGGERQAAFRWVATNTDEVALFAMDFGFNRRSGGADLRPRLLLFTEDQGAEGYPDGAVCDSSTPPPVISGVGIHDGLEADSVTVSWETDVPSDSLVLFREQGTADWTQVGTPARTLVHHVQVFGLDSATEYEFAVRSAACNGATTTDTNGGEGYDFFFHPEPPPDPGPRTEHSSYDFEGGAQGWTVESSVGSLTQWDRRSPGQDSNFGWHASPYFDQNETSLISPPLTVSGAQVGVEFFSAHDTEPTFDFLHVDYSTDGEVWKTARSIDGQNPGFPGFDPYDVRFNHPDPGATLQVRFRFKSDDLVSSPLFQGVAVDTVAVASYPNALPEDDRPTSGPATPPSAGATGLNPPPTRTGPASDADVAAGTGSCVIPAGEAGEPDLTLSSSDIALSKKKVVGGDQVTVKATIHNVGDGDATDVAVRFTDNGNQIGADQIIAFIAAGGTGQAQVVWDTKHLKGEHTITVTADPGDAIDESDETNNSASVTVTVRGNKVRNGSFEESQDGQAPDAWTSEGDTTYAEGGSEGEHSVTTGGPTSSWTSEPIAVAAGGTYGLSVDVMGAGGTLVVEQLSATGDLLGTLSVVLSVVDDGLFHTVTDTVVIGEGVAEVRVKLTGALVGISTFDDVRMWEE
jgi:hypothetical protein